jgi:hypothetical protein
MYRDADEVESFGAESLILADRLQALLEHLGITTAPRYRIQEVSRSRRVEFKAITEILFGSKILCRHKGPAFRTSRSDAIADAAWHAITSWVHSNKSRLQNSVHYLLPYQKKDQFKAYGVKNKNIVDYMLKVYKLNFVVPCTSCPCIPPTLTFVTHPFGSHWCVI